METCCPKGVMEFPFIMGDAQNPSGHGPEQPAVSRRLDWTTSRGSCPDQPCCGFVILQLCRAAQSGGKVIIGVP